MAVSILSQACNVPFSAVALLGFLWREIETSGRAPKVKGSPPLASREDDLGRQVNYPVFLADCINTLKFFELCNPYASPPPHPTPLSSYSKCEAFVIKMKSTGDLWINILTFRHIQKM